MNHQPRRKSKMDLHQTYFWTSTIKDWNNLLQQDDYKMIIIEQLQWLILRKKIKLFCYVIMPNHIHFVWKMLAMNGKESPYASFNKWTAGQFLKLTRVQAPTSIKKYI